MKLYEVYFDGDDGPAMCLFCKRENAEAFLREPHPGTMGGPGVTRADYMHIAEIETED